MSRARLVPALLAGWSLLAGCESTAPPPTPIAGRTFDIVSISGRAMPTTISLRCFPASGPGVPNGCQTACVDTPVGKVTLLFATDGTFVETFVSPLGTSQTIRSSFSEPRTGTLAIVSAADSATVVGNVMHVRLSLFNCGTEDLVAQAM